MKGLKNHAHLAPYFLALVAYATLLGTTPFLDDWSFIFNSQLKNQISSLLEHWVPGQDNFRAWPLAHTVFFVYRQMGVAAAPLLFAVNLVLHLGNLFLFRKLLLRFGAGSLLVPSLFFALSASAVFTIGQINQVSLLLSTGLFLGAALVLTNPQPRGDLAKGLTSGVLAGLSLLAKPAWILVPLVLLAPPLFRRNRLRNGIFLLIFAAFSYWSITATLGGVRSSRQETYASKTFTQTDFQDFHIGEIKDSTKPPQGAPQEASPSVFSLDRDRLTLALNNFGFYARHTFLFFDSVYFYPKELALEDGLAGLLGVLFCLVSLFAAFRWAREAFCTLLLGWSIMLLAFLPVCGIAYVPYMKFSFVSHHWWGPALAGFSVVLAGLGEVAHRKWSVGTIRWLSVGIAFGLFLQTAWLAFDFSHREEFLERNLTVNSQSTAVMSLLADEVQRAGDIPRALRILDGAIALSPYDFSLRSQFENLKRQQP